LKNIREGRIPMNHSNPETQGIIFSNMDPYSDGQSNVSMLEVVDTVGTYSRDNVTPYLY